MTSLEYTAATALWATALNTPIALLSGQSLAVARRDELGLARPAGPGAGPAGPRPHELVAHPHPVWLGSTLTLAIPVTSTLLAWLFIDEQVRALQFAGMGLVIVALGLIVRRTSGEASPDGSREPSPETPREASPDGSREPSPATPRPVAARGEGAGTRPTASDGATATTAPSPPCRRPRRERGRGRPRDQPASRTAPAAADPSTTGSAATGSVPHCGACGRVVFHNPAVGVAIVVLDDEGRLLLARRARTYAGEWCIPCGYVEWDEDVRVAASASWRRRRAWSSRSTTCSPCTPTSMTPTSTRWASGSGAGPSAGRCRPPTTSTRWASTDSTSCPAAGLPHRRARRRPAPSGARRFPPSAHRRP